MSTAAVSIDKRRRIESLWKRLRCLKIHTPEYETILSEIRVLSMECDKLFVA
jgi:hypothetical protein